MKLINVKLVVATKHKYLLVKNTKGKGEVLAMPKERPFFLLLFKVILCFHSFFMQREFYLLYGLMILSPLIFAKSFSLLVMSV